MNEFWKVLPAALKHVYDSGGDSGKKAATRLVSARFNSIVKISLVILANTNPHTHYFFILLLTVLTVHTHIIIMFYFINLLVM